MNNGRAHPEPKKEPTFDGNNPSNSNGDNKNNNTNNNNDPNTVKVDDVWGTTKTTKTEELNNSGNQNGNNSQQQSQTVDPKELLKKHLEELNLGSFTFTDQQKEALKNGEGYDELAKIIEARTVAAYTGAMKNMNEVVNNRVKSAVEEAMKGSRDLLEGVRLKDYLDEQLPWTKGNKVLGPVVETAFKSFYEKTGNDREQAIKLTKQFLKSAGGEINKNDPEFKNFNSETFRGNQQAADENQDWLSVLQRRG
jgi:hypothetical protein